MKSKTFSLTFCGASRTVTGSKFLLEAGGCQLLVDCGLFEGWRELRERNWQPLPLPVRELDAIILTHAHLDHSGAVPLIIKQGYRGVIHATPATMDLCSILLPDSGFLQEEDAANANRHGWSRHKPALPLYTAQEARESLERFHPLPLGRVLKLDEGRISVTLQEAGHILGAASALVKTPFGSVFFSGDVGRMHDPLMETPAKPPLADYYVIESTYGARQHENVDVAEQIGAVIRRTAARGGTVLVPAFAVGRTQTLLHHLAELRQKQKIPDLPIYLDSPMAMDATEMFCTHSTKLTREEAERFCAIATFTRSREESKQLDDGAMPSIIIAASGMLTGGRILHHLKRYVGDARHTIMLTGYQSDGTRGDFLQRGAGSIKIHGSEWPVEADVVTIQNLSAHADSEEILGWLKQAPRAPKKVFLVHGNDEALQGLSARIEERLHWRTEIPGHRQEVDLS